MRILTVSDKVEPVLYSPYIRERVGKIDVVLACGDLPYYYLEYIVDQLDTSLFFVHGNHDKVIPAAMDGPALFGAPTTMSWAVNLHQRTACFKGLLLAGLEGCRMYNPNVPFQYTEGDVNRQAFFLSQRLFLNRLRYGRGLDILLTHAPPAGIHDDTDLPHRGFAAYLTLLRRFHPLLMIHGHQHVYNRLQATETDYEATRIINTYGYRVMELAQCEDGDKGRGGWKLVSSSR
jgi:Icc-related predicted phosphoesterase